MINNSHQTDVTLVIHSYRHHSYTKRHKFTYSGWFNLFRSTIGEEQHLLSILHHPLLRAPHKRPS